MKLEYVCAFAFQIELTRHTSVDKMSTGRLPKVVLIGTLDRVNLPVNGKFREVHHTIQNCRNLPRGLELR